MSHSPDGSPTFDEAEGAPTVSLSPDRGTETLNHRADRIPSNDEVPPRPFPSVPGYEIECELGRGGMGIVYKARQHRLTRDVALKVVLAGEYASADHVVRFVGEAETAARLRHQGIVQIFESGLVAGQPFFSMEYVDGGSLDDRLTAGRLPPSAAANLVRLLAEAVAHAHECGVVHRDLKPANILLTADGRPKVTDFGLAMRLGVPDRLTRTGTVMGTPSYMAPEQARGDIRAVGPAADVYSLGAVLYHCLSGRPPFAGKTLADTLSHVQNQPPPAVRSSAAGVPHDLETIALKCLEKDPGKRYPSAFVLAEDLRRWQEGRTITARRVGRLEKAWRWGKRNPAVAALLATVFGMLTAVSAVSILAAMRIDVARRAAETAADAARQALAREADARDAAQRQVVAADLATANLQVERAEPGLALHWTARAWQDDADRVADGGKSKHGAEANHRLRLASAISRLPRLVGLCPHDRPVADADSDPAGDRVVTVGCTLTPRPGLYEHHTEVRDSVARVWDAGRAELMYPPLAHDGPVTSAVFAPDGRRIATSSDDGTVRVWDAATGRPVWTSRLGGPVARVTFRPDGKTLAAVRGEAVHFRAADSGEPAGEPVAIGGPADYVAYSPEGGKLVTLTTAGEARVWDADTREPLSDPLPFLRFGENEVEGKIDFLEPMEGQRWPTFSPDGRRLAVADGTCIRVWSAERVVIIPVADRALQQIQAAFGPDGDMLVYVVRRYGRGVVVYDLAAGKEVGTGSTPRLRCGLAVSPDGKQAAVPVSVGYTYVFDLPWAVRRPLPLPLLDFVTRVWFTRDGKRLLTASRDGTVRVWEPTPAEPQPEPDPKAGGQADRLVFPTRRFSPDGTREAVYDPLKLELRVGPTGGPHTPLPTRVSHWYTTADEGQTKAFTKFVARFSPDGRHLVAFSRSDEGGQPVTAIESWATDQTGDQPSGRVLVAGPAWDFAFSADGRRLGVSVRSPAFSPDGPGSMVDQFHVYDFPSLRPLVGPVGQGLSRLPGSLALSRAGDLLAVTQFGLDRIPAWDVPSGDRLPGGRIDPSDLRGLEFGPRDDRLLVELTTGALGQWDVRSGRQAGPTLLPPRETSLYARAYSPDQTRVVAQTIPRGLDRIHLAVYSVDEGDLIASIPVPPGAVGARGTIWFSTDGRRVITHAPGTTNVLSWPLPEYPGRLDRVPALSHLLTGTTYDPLAGFVRLPQDALRSNPEPYRRAFRASKALPEE